MPETIKTLHFGDKLIDIENALKRVKYEELLKYQMSMKYLHYMRQQNNSCFEINPNYEMLEKFWATLPYELTVDQKKVIQDIFKDLKAKYAMNRLLQGEVGSGKTVVAVSAILAAVSDGYQAALMCPTEILSQQHYETIKQMSIERMARWLIDEWVYMRHHELCADSEKIKEWLMQEVKDYELY